MRTLFRLMNSHVGSGGVEKFADNPQAESHTLTNARSDEKKEAETSLPLKLAYVILSETALVTICCYFSNNN